jgi:hypothetical protein
MSTAHEVPPPVQMVQMLAGFQLSQALYAAAVLGVADLMTAGPVPAGVLAEQAGAHPPSLLRCSARWPAPGCSPSPSPASSR